MKLKENVDLNSLKELGFEFSGTTQLAIFRESEKGRVFIILRNLKIMQFRKLSNGSDMLVDIEDPELIKDLIKADLINKVEE